MSNATGKYVEFLSPFVGLMEKELHANSSKGDRPAWLAMSADTCMLEVFYHVGKLQKAVRDSRGDAMQEHAADTANLCMMMLDICGALPVYNRAPQQPALGGELEPIGKIFDEKYNSVVFYRRSGDATKRYHPPGTEFVALDTAQTHVARLQADLTSANADKEAYAQNAIDLRRQLDASRTEIERLKAITCTSMGVGDGSGQLIVHGDYDSIKAAQRILWERDDLKTRAAELEGLLREMIQQHVEAGTDYTAVVGKARAALAEGAKS